MTKLYDENRIFMLNDAQMRVCPALANEIGLNESVIFLQLEYLVAIKGKWHEDRRWIRLSLGDLETEFPFWGKATIFRAIKALESRGLIIVESFNAAKYDRTSWYAINIEKAKSLHSIAVKGYEIVRETSVENPVENPVKHGGMNQPRSNMDRLDLKMDRLPVQNGPTIIREINTQNKNLENTHTAAGPPPPHEPAPSQPGVCEKPKSKYSIDERIEHAERYHLGEGWIYASADGRHDASIERSRARGDLWDLVEEVKPPGHQQNLCYSEARESIEVLVAAQGRDPTELIDELPVVDEVREKLKAENSRSKTREE